jgi:cupin 2 domain-containing protein
MTDNLFAGLSAAPEIGERFDILFERTGLKIERIVSTGQSSPPGFWYDQAHAEWVAVLRGEARLRFADEAAARLLQAGDFVLIEPHRRHRVEATSTAEPTVWLALHFDSGGALT